MHQNIKNLKSNLQILFNGYKKKKKMEKRIKC